jgi:hypothetical protein
VASRADAPPAEEQRAGSDDPVTQAEQVLAESDARALDREGTSREHRASEDTVEPPPE